MPAPPTTDNRVCVARIGAPHGVRGEVRLHAFTEDPLAVARYGALEAEDGSRSFAIDKVRPANGFLVARLVGVDDRDAAERLKHCRLFVPRDRLPALEDADDFYHADLVGLDVVDRDGHGRGTVAAIHNFGAGDLVEVKPPSGPTVLLPFTKAVVPVVDLDARRLVVEPPAGSFPRPDQKDGERGEPAAEPCPPAAAVAATAPQRDLLPARGEREKRLRRKASVRSG